ncbi:helix-turn-helix domain-containing protein [Liquorilactobacillus satsumensis]|uniref:AraC family transcriptional regulator n=1 Tax=Liquorilactobacillus satsumensis DSM 16230 = JCM 12392 TaxID=1423801 RepID=A0A0R1V012_9LACO|nr:AraC family transcriptional regulator [Liquorilactobacillus satsumensis]KRL98943.1 AraC family transcriptional regulator [Liquorilactobacillus satsumensis DSM 16230 = JCM 12392]
MSIQYIQATSNGSTILKKCSNVLQTARLQFHDRVSIGIIEEGSCIAHVDQTETLCKNTLIVMPTNYVHWCQPLNVFKWRYQMLFIEKKIFLRQPCPQTVKLTNLQTKKILQLFKIITKSHELSEKEKVDLLKSEFSTFLQNPQVPPFSTQIDSRLTKTVSYMSENYQFPLKINELADLSGISKYHFIRLFKSNYHLSPAKYLVNCRVNNAQKDLIQKNNSSMAEIAYQNGFYDESHFDRLFKQYTGVSPKKFKLQVTSR